MVSHPQPCCGNVGSITHWATIIMDDRDIKRYTYSTTLFSFTNKKTCSPCPHDMIGIHHHVSLNKQRPIMLPFNIVEQDITRDKCIYSTQLENYTKGNSTGNHIFLYHLNIASVKRYKSRCTCSPPGLHFWHWTTLPTNHINLCKFKWQRMCSLVCIHVNSTIHSSQQV